MLFFRFFLVATLSSILVGANIGDFTASIFAAVVLEESAPLKKIESKGI